MGGTVIVITTIHVPTVLEYIKGDCSVLVVGDKKTPPEARGYCESHNAEYLGIEEQEKLLPPKLLDLFPYNTPDRVILGCMLAYLRGCDRTIALDDDNFPVHSMFVHKHSIAGNEVELDLFENDEGWFNVHSLLFEEKGIPFYPRGFPWSKRTERASTCKMHLRKKVKVIVNQGLVIGDPDIDALTRLAHPINVKGFNSENTRIGLLNTWSPFNYQNTCLSREMIPLYYRPPSASRNSDIWTSYLFNKLAEHFGDVIAFGHPLVKQVRNEHNLWDDLDLELVNNRATDQFVEILKNVELTETTYSSALVELLHKAELPTACTAEEQMIWGFFTQYSEWYSVVKDLI